MALRGFACELASLRILAGAGYLGLHCGGPLGARSHGATHDFVGTRDGSRPPRECVCQRAKFSLEFDVSARRRRCELMRLISPGWPAYQAGTLSGNPLAVAAGLATLGLLGDRAYRRLTGVTERLADGLETVAARAGVALHVARKTGLLTLFFSSEDVRDLGSARRVDLDAYGRFCRGMLDRGIYLPPSPFEAWFPSIAHADEHVELTLSAAADVFAGW
jgi:glutamate-1-semialdehyde aminotransferase